MAKREVIEVLDTHSVMTKDEYDEWARGTAAHDASQGFRLVRLSGCAPQCGVRSVQVLCSPEVEPRVRAWLGRVAQRYGWGGSLDGGAR